MKFNKDDEFIVYICQASRAHQDETIKGQNASPE